MGERKSFSTITIETPPGVFVVHQVPPFDYHDKRELDRFLARFPDSPISAVLFHLRFECCRQLSAAVPERLTTAQHRESCRQAISEYQQFIATYPDRLQSKIAVHQCFNLYRRLDEVAGYREFIALYPHSEPRPVAEQQICRCLYREACQLDTIAAYDNFVALYPGRSAWSNDCIERTQRLAINRARAEKQKLTERVQHKLATASSDDRELRLRQEIKAVVESRYLAEILEIREQCHRRYPSAHERARYLLYDSVRYRRIKKVLHEVFRREAAAALLTIESFDDIKQMQEELRRHLDAGRRELLAAMDKHFGDLKQRLAADHEILRGELQKLQRELQRDLARIHDEVGAVRQDLAGFEQKMQLNFAAMHREMATLHHGLQRLHNDIQLGFDGLDEQLQLSNASLAKIYDHLHQATPPTWVPRFVRQIVRAGANSLGQFVIAGYQKIQTIITGRPQQQYSGSALFVTGRNREGDGYGNKWSEQLHYGRVRLDRVRLTVEELAAEFDREMIRQLQDSHGELLLCIHGFNESFRSAAQWSIRLGQELGLGKAVLTYCWPSQHSLYHYDQDRSNAVQAGKILAAVLDKLRKTGQLKRLYILAHSMGNYVLANAWSQAPPPDYHRVAQVVMVAPDIDAVRFKRELIGPFRRRADKITIYASSNDVALIVSRVKNRGPRLGDVDIENGPYVVVKGIDTIDVSAARSLLVNHSHHQDPRVVADIRGLFQGKSLENRDLLKQTRVGIGFYWRLGNKLFKRTTLDATARQRKNQRAVTITAWKYGLPPQIWTQSIYRCADGREVVDMTGEYWYNLSVSDQQRYAAQYQRGYAASVGQPVEKTFSGGGTEMVMRLIPPGRYWMGSPDSEKDRGSDERRHRVVISRPYWLGKYEVTQGQWQAVMGSNPAYFTSVGSNAPVEKVSWEQCQQFCTKTGWRLPSEGEWEYACRAGTTTPFNLGGNITPAQVNYDGNYPYSGAAKGEYREKTVVVGSLASPNAWGCHDMSGNVWEWCQDWQKDYSAQDQSDPTGPPTGSSRVCRGGGWGDGACGCRSAIRDGDSPGDSGSSLGFRAARSL